MRMYTEKMRLASSFLAAEGSPSVSAAGSKGRLQQDITDVDCIQHCIDRMSESVKTRASWTGAQSVYCLCMSVTNLQFFR